ncbi:clathrin heavy chain linker domain-containing protein 1-like [Brachionichthys hirsutus]
MSVWAGCKNNRLCGRGVKTTVCVGGVYLSICRYRRLGIVSEHLSSLEGHKRTLEELLGSTLQNVRRAAVTDEDARRIDVELSEDNEPTGVDRPKLLSDYLDRFSELFGSAQYDEAALLAARAPGGVLRNLDTMEMFKGVEGPPGSAPPLLLFLRALLASVPPEDKLPAVVSQQAVLHALRHGATRLVAHAVANDKLTPSEDLGDLLTQHAHQNRGVADTCLALSTVVYEACGLDRKIALSMCRRGLIHGAAESMKHAEGLAAEDCMWVLARSSSLSLFQLLTEPLGGQSAILSVGVACSTLLANPQHRDFGLEILDSFVSRGRGVLEEVILEDSSSSVDVWTRLASLCSELNRSDLSQAITSVLLDQSGTRVLSPDLEEGARIVEHIFL